MSFRIVIDKAGEHCDICNKLDKEKPMLRLFVNSRHDHQMIWAHLDCFERRFSKAKALAEKTAIE